MTPKQQRFVDEYLVDLNATQAAIRSGYSHDTARSIGSENLTKPDIQDAIAKRQAELARTLKVTPEKVIAEYAKIAFQDIRNVVRWGSHPLDTESENASPNGLNIYPVFLVPSEELGPDVAAAVAEVSLTQSGVRVKMHDKKGALDSLAKHLGMFTERIDVRVVASQIKEQVKELDDSELLAIIARGRGASTDGGPSRGDETRPN